MSKRENCRWTVSESPSSTLFAECIDSICQQLKVNGRERPNILVTGTPCCGKTTFCRDVMSKLPKDSRIRYFPISELAKEHRWYEEYDDEMEASILNERSMLKWLRPHIQAQGCLVDFHGCDLFPQKWFDFVIVLKTDKTEILYDRYVARGYPQAKITENMTCEMMQVIAEEAYNHFGSDRCIIVKSNTESDMKANVDLVSRIICHLSIK